MTLDQIEQMAREAGLLHGPADDVRSKLMLAALGLFAQVVREAALKDAIVALDALQRYALDKQAPGLFKNNAGGWFKAEAAIAAIQAIAHA